VIFQQNVVIRNFEVDRARKNLPNEPRNARDVRN
jgi:hypothetical protein